MTPPPPGSASIVASPSTSTLRLSPTGKWKRKFLGLSALDHSKDLLTLPKPSICPVWGSFACKFCRLVTHEVLHCHWSDRGNHRPRLRCRRLHRVHHPMDCIGNLINPSIIHAPPISHCLHTPHNSAVHIKQL